MEDINTNEGKINDGVLKNILWMQQNLLKTLENCYMKQQKLKALHKQQRKVLNKFQIKTQIHEKITKEKLLEVSKELQTKFNDTIQELPAKLSETTNNAKEFTTSQIKSSVEFIQNNGKEVVNNYAIPIVTTIAEGITDNAYNIDQKYHIVGKIGHTVKDIDSKLGITDKTEQINNYFGISTMINSVVEKGKQLDEYLTGGVGTNIANKGIEIGQQFVNYALNEVTKVHELTSISTPNNDETNNDNIEAMNDNESKLNISDNSSKDKDE